MLSSPTSAPGELKLCIVPVVPLSTAGYLAHAQVYIGELNCHTAADPVLDAIVMPKHNLRCNAYPEGHDVHP
jgi:hypothetical protein